MERLTTFKDYMMNMKLKNSKVLTLADFMQDSLDNIKAEEMANRKDRGETVYDDKDKN